MKFDIRNRFTGDVQFTAEIDCAEYAPLSIKIGLAVRWAYRTRADLSGADLSEAVLSGADLSGADLLGADLSGADLLGADLSGADLSEAVLSGAVLSGAVLSGAVLSGAVLSGADLSGADLSEAVLPYGFKDSEPPKSLKEAAQRTRDWLAHDHWIQGFWIDTPTHAYAGDCLACLHGAAVYCGGEFGRRLSNELFERG